MFIKTNSCCSKKSQHLRNTCYKQRPSLVKSAIFQNNYFNETARNAIIKLNIGVKSQMRRTNSFKKAL